MIPTLYHFLIIHRHGMIQRIANRPAIFWYNVDMSIPVPTEDQEQIDFIRWLDEEGIPYWHVPNETFAPSWAAKAKNKKLGVKAGIPDLFLVFKEGLLCIEMKRTVGGKLSDYQMMWHEILAMSGTPVFTCKGAEAAEAQVKEVLKTWHKVDRKKLREIQKKYTEKYVKIAKNGSKSVKKRKNFTKS